MWHNGYLWLGEGYLGLGLGWTMGHVPQSCYVLALLQHTNIRQ